MDEGNHVLNMVRRFKKTPLKAEIIEAFVDVDTNSSSLISRSELRDGLQKKFNIDVTEEELDDVFHRMDVTGDDRLDIVEFCDFLTSEVDRLHQKHHLADNIDSESSSSYNPSELQTKPVARQESTSEAIKAKQLLQENSTVTPAYVPMSSDEGTDHQHHPSDVTVTPVYVPMNSEEGNHNQQQHDLVATPVYVPINSEEGNHNQQQHDVVATPVYVPMNSEEGNHGQQQHDLVATPVYIPMDSEGGNQNQQQHAADAKPIYQPMKSEVDKADKAYDEAVIASPKKNNVDDEPSKLSPSLHSPEVKGEHTVQPIASNKVSTILDDTNAEIPEAKNQKSTKVSAQPPPKSFSMGNSKVYPEQVPNFHIHIKHRMNPFRIFCITLCGLMLIFIVALSVSFVRLFRSDVTTGQHTIQPTIQPTDMPTSHSPTMTPTLAPTYFPTFAPTPPTPTPTDAPTDAPTDTPTDTPTNAPTPSTPSPTNAPTPPTPAPTPVPTNAPTPPTPAPTNAPTNAPTPPTPAPTNAPTPPTPAPTNAPTPPTPAPTHAPTQAPTNEQAPEF